MAGSQSSAAPAPILYGLRPAAGAACSASFELSLGARTLDADRDYRPVFLLPRGAHATVVLSIHDKTGQQQLFSPTHLELSPDDGPLLLHKPALPAVAAPVAIAPSSATGGTGGGGGFDAASRRNRRRLRGFRMGGGGGFGGGGFTRGSGSFLSPRRGVS